MTREEAEREVENVSIDEAVDILMAYHKIKQRIESLAGLIHYPQHWDTACYPTLEDALEEIGCSECMRASTEEATNDNQNRS